MLEPLGRGNRSQNGEVMPQRHPSALNAEIERLQRNCADRPRGREFAIGTRWNRAGTDVDFIYRSNQLICEADDLDQVLTAIESIGQTPPVHSIDGPVGLKVLDIGDRDAADLADQLSDILGDDVATPNHVLDVKSTAHFCPASEPVPWTGPVTDLGTPVGPGQPTIAVVDDGGGTTLRLDHVTQGSHNGANCTIV
jgi:hypothetical protein